jgi:serine/threonine protein kinase
MDDLTRAAGDAPTASTLTSSSGSGWGRFAPGTLLAGRFRIVAPLGRGGMGEVYRADDLKLDQTVALKFLPDDLMHDAARLAQFHNEVRVARTISHRNVCRTYDIGDADGRPFLTMEYVDGEDLSSLLRRIGRFPQEKAIEVARQICAGVAAAHERGVLHRDLKPANVMLDGEGHVRLTDFGLAAIAGSVDNIRAGTPAYMAPEQLAGREVTQRSDIYALGLVLYELFTGKRVFEAGTLNDLIKLHESGAMATPSSLVRDLDPIIERAIQRCLEREPAKRPSSALAVSAALPGGDQLAAALAAGETPSPEMVAAAGEQSALRPAIGAGLVAFTLIMLTLLTLASDRFQILNRIPLPRSNDSLNDRAQELIERFGYRDAPMDTARGWALNREYLIYARAEKGATPWPAIESGRTRTALFWYRTSPSPLIASADNSRPTETDPPLAQSDMRLVRLDPHGRLVEFHSIPPQVEEAPARAAREPEWAALFDAAGLTLSSFHDVASQWTPRGDADVRRAWEGPLPELVGLTVRVEAAAYRGRPIFFSVLPPWTSAGRAASAPQRGVARLLTSMTVLLAFALLATAAGLARRHLRTGRGDRRGAFRTAALMFVSLSAAFILGARVYSAPEVEYELLGRILSLALYVAVTVWLFYVALEPYVRRFWPQLLIGWTRALSGRLRDPLVGRDVLVGVAAGMIGALLIASRLLIPRALGLPLAAPELPDPSILFGTRFAISSAIQIVRRAIVDSMQIVGIVVFLKIMVRRNWLVFVLGTLAVLPIAMSGTFAGEQLALELAISLTGIALIFTVLLRFGLLSLIITIYTFLAIEGFPLTTDLSKPYAGAAFLLSVAIAGFSVLGFYASRGDEPLFDRTLLD